MLLRKVFEIVGQAGIIGPHGHQEADLLLAGRKPVGLLSIVDESRYTTPEGREVGEKTRADIARLDIAVEDGKLLKQTVRIDSMRWPEIDDGSGPGFTCHFYAQPNKEHDLNVVRQFHENLWREGDVEDLPQDIGKYLGYTDNDIALWANGGHDVQNPVSKYLRIKLNSVRRYCRIKSMLTGAKPDI